MAELTSKIESTTGAASKAKKELKGLAAQSTATGAAMAAMGGAAGTATGAISGLVGILGTAEGLTVAAAAKASSFEKAMRGVARTASLTEEEVSSLSKSILQLSRTTPRSRNELARIATEAGRLGIESTENIRRFTNVVQQMAAVSELSVGRAAKELGKISEALGRPTSSIRDLADTVDKLSITTAASTGEITRSMRKMASGMTEAVNIGAEGVTALSATLDAMGQEPARAGTRLRRVLNQLTDPEIINEMASLMNMNADDLAKSLRKDATPTLVEFLETVNETGRAGEIFNEKFVSSAAAALIPLSENIDKVKQNLDSAKDSFGTVAKEFEQQVDNLRQQGQIFQTTVGSIFTEIGLEPLKPMTEGMEEAVGAVQQIDGEKVDAFKEMTKSFGEFTGEVIALSGTGVSTLFAFGEALGEITDVDLLQKGADLNLFAENVGSAIKSLRVTFEENVLGFERLSGRLDEQLVNIVRTESLTTARKKVRELNSTLSKIGKGVGERQRGLGERAGAFALENFVPVGLNTPVNTLLDSVITTDSEKKAKETEKELKAFIGKKVVAKSGEVPKKFQRQAKNRMINSVNSYLEAVEKSGKEVETEGLKNELEKQMELSLTDLETEKAEEIFQKQAQETIRSLLPATKRAVKNQNLGEELNEIIKKEGSLFSAFKNIAPQNLTEENKNIIKPFLDGIEQDTREGTQSLLNRLKSDPPATKFLNFLVKQFNKKAKDKSADLKISELFSDIGTFEELAGMENLQSKLLDRIPDNLEFDLKEELNVEQGLKVSDIIGEVEQGNLTKFRKKMNQASKPVQDFVNGLLKLDKKQKKVFANLEGTTKKVAQSMKDGFKSAANVFNQEMGRMATGAEVSTARIRDAFIQNLVSGLNQRLVSQPILNALAPKGGGGGISEFLNFLPGIGQKAKGGRLRKGELSVVGERGPEVIASQSKGRVMSNREMRESLKGGGKQPEINIINKSGEKTETRQRSQNGKPITDIIIGEVSKDIRKNGQVAQAMSSSFGVQRQGQRM